MATVVDPSDGPDRQDAARPPRGGAVVRAGNPPPGAQDRRSSAPREWLTRMLNSPEGLVPHLRKLFLFFSLLLAAGIVPLIAFEGVSMTPLRVAGLASLPLLGSNWVLGYRKGRLPLAGDLVDGVGLFMVAWAVGDPSRALGVFLGSLSLRSLYGSTRRVLGGLTLYLASFYAAAVFAPVASSTAQLIEVAIGFIMASTVMHALASTAMKHWQTNRELRRSEERKEAILDTALDSIITADHQGRIIDFNPAAERTFGFSRTEVLGKELAETIVPPASREAHRRGITRYVSTGEARLLGRRVEISAMRSDGSEFPVELTITATEQEGHPVFTAYARDITQRKLEEKKLREAETKYRALVESLPAIVYTARFGAEGQWLYVSPQIESILGFSPDEWLGDSTLWFERIHPDDRERALEDERRSRSRGGDLRSEYRMLARDGRVVWIRDEGTVIHDESGNPTFIQGVMLDISTRKELEEQLRQSQKMEAVGQLAGGVAHDFNNLLFVMETSARFLQETLPESDSGREDVDEIIQAAERASALTRQLLTFSRREIVRAEVLNLNDVIGRNEELLRRALTERIDLDLHLSSHLWNTKIDRTQLEQILMNLTVNARDAMPGDGRLIIATSNFEGAVPGSEDERPARYACLTVTDTGRGMTPEVKERIFEPFFTTKARGTGTGLGLATVYGIVEQAGGHLSVDSDPGAGTSFSILLPASKAPALAPSDGQGRAGSMGGGETILVAEDEDAVRELIRRILSRSGYEVLEASTGHEALNVFHAQKRKVDLLLTDVVMPHMSGRELALQLHKAGTGVKTLYMSGYSNEIIADHGVLSGSEAFIYKPFTPDRLLAKIRKTLDGD